MFNYLGPNIGPTPVATTLPSAPPGTMPSGVPGVQPSPAPLPPARPLHPAVGMHPAAHGHRGGANPAALAAIVRHVMPPGAGHAPMAPPHPEYATTTQTDGSILLHIKNPDGSKGPVVKVINPIKRSDNSGPKLG